MWIREIKSIAFALRGHRHRLSGAFISERLPIICVLRLMGWFINLLV